MSRPNTIGMTQSIESDEWSAAPLDDRLVVRRYDAETAQRTARVACLAAPFRLGICLRSWSSSDASNSAIRSVQTSSETFLYSAFFQHPVQGCLTSRAASSACIPATFSDGSVPGNVHIRTGHRRVRGQPRPLHGLEGEEIALGLIRLENPPRAQRTHSDVRGHVPPETRASARTPCDALSRVRGHSVCVFSTCHP